MFLKICISEKSNRSYKIHSIIHFENDLINDKIATKFSFALGLSSWDFLSTFLVKIYSSTISDSHYPSAEG